MTNCKDSCPHFHNGKGSKPCLTCDKITDKAIFKNSELPRQGALYHAIRLDKDILENLNDPHLNDQLRDVFKILPQVTRLYATILLQTTLLGMRREEIARFHGITPRHVGRLIQKALDEVRGKL